MGQIGHNILTTNDLQEQWSLSLNPQCSRGQLLSYCGVLHCGCDNGVQHPSAVRSPKAAW